LASIYSQAHWCCALQLGKALLKAKLAIGPEVRGITLEKMLNDIRPHFGPLQSYDSNKIDAFRKTRNHIVHFGFSPKDDQKCAMLLLDAGLPFLNLCYQVLFDFFLDWQEIRPGAPEFSSLSLEEMNKAGLLPEVAKQLRFARDIYRLANKVADINYVSCFGSLIHFIRLGLKETARTESEWEIIDRADTHGTKFELEQKSKEDLERLLDPSWLFDCPICNGVDSLVAEINEAKLVSGEVVSERCACVQCGFVVGKGAPYISQALLAEAIVQKQATILKEFGIRQE
jgi:hypothetical protein